MAKTDDEILEGQGEEEGAKAEPLVEQERPEGEQPAPEGEAAKPKPAAPEYGRAVQKRISELTREKHEERRRAAALEAENAALKRQMGAGPRPMPPDPRTFATEAGEIDPAKWQHAIAAYEDKLDTWRQTQRPAAPAAAREPEPTEVPAASAEVFLERAAPLREKHADFDETVNRPVFSPALRDALFDSEQGPAIAYALGKNQAEALRIGGLPPAQLHREVGRLEARFAGPTDRRSVSAAPEPIEPVHGTAAAVTKDPDKMSIGEYMQWERSRLIERKKANPFAGA